jgi:hypothetical protein
MHHKVQYIHASKSTTHPCITKFTTHKNQSSTIVIAVWVVRVGAITSVHAVELVSL